MQPLDSVRVLDMSRLLPGPFCTLALSDLGAQVDKLEDPHVGDYLRFVSSLGTTDGPAVSGRFWALNRDKRSLCLDLKQAAGRSAFLRLVPHYQVLVESFRPGVLHRLGLSLAALWERNPALVVCSISGYGQDGPYRDRAGHDLNYLAMSGVLSLSGSAQDAAPHPLPIQLADLGAGGLWAALGIVAALRKAEKTGQGSHIDLSMCEGAASFLLPDLGQQMASPDAPPPRRGEDALTGGLACYGVYRTRDDKFVSVAALEPKFWSNLNRVLNRPADPSELLSPPEEQQRIRAELAALFSQKTRAEWEQVFASEDACVEPVLEPHELATHPLHVGREVFFSAEGPFSHVRTPLRPRGPGCGQPPALGQHSSAILRESGFSDAEIELLQKGGVTR